MFDLEGPLAWGIVRDGKQQPAAAPPSRIGLGSESDRRGWRKGDELRAGIIAAVVPAARDTDEERHSRNHTADLREILAATRLCEHPRQPYRITRCQTRIDGCRCEAAYQPVEIAVVHVRAFHLRERRPLPYPSPRRIIFDKRGVRAGAAF
ncbi:hypothetical protein [Sphingomonas koreensis]|uniref:hypothetical protein n=1 Tax=Sphingomonas koreensis TaxID=93064 RepID=UPI00234EAE09|nr:hypothetical protein [Sphingomonas koreensis]MDC7810162.1 hypothetical protein [Sphingomonas koreensis]